MHHIYSHLGVNMQLLILTLLINVTLFYDEYKLLQEETESIGSGKLEQKMLENTVSNEKVRQDIQKQ